MSCGGESLRLRRMRPGEFGGFLPDAENDGESGGRLPTVRHAHLLGLIGRSHFPAQAQAEECEDRSRLASKRKAELPRAVERSFIYDRTSNGPMTAPWGTPLRQKPPQKGRRPF